MSKLKKVRAVERSIVGKSYTYFTKKRKIILFIAGILVVVAFFFNLMSGSSGMSIQEVFNAIFNPSQVSLRARTIVWDIRLPMAIMGVLVGAALSVSGSVMQTILNNYLASPYTLGVSAGASVGAAIVLVFGVSSLSVLGQFLIPSFAFIFSGISCLGIYFISRKKGFNSNIMVLSGIGMVFFFQAFQSFLQYISSEETLQSIVFWTFGSLLKSNWSNISILAIVFGIIFFIFMKNAWKLTAMKLGDSRAKSMGVNINKIRKTIFILISILTATAVSFVGSIGFVGIIGPHISRMLIGEDQRYFIPLSTLVGAIILSVASGITKIIIPGAVFPIGIITSLIGVPFFFILLLRK